MKIEANILVGLAVFFAVVSLGYWFWSYEPAGTAMLAGTVLFGLLPGAYYFWWAKRMKPRTEDRPDATLKEGAGVVGSFPGSSIWPFVLGMGLFLVVLSLVFGTWLLVVGGAITLYATIGVTAESRRGGAV
ncbi:MAG: aa3-type cytochrome oxidase subunit IV [Acidimicrobiales bacterium]